jgi:(2Fe-2S) ferredoxin
MNTVIRTQADLDHVAAYGLATLYPRRLKILVGSASCGLAAGSRAVEEAALETIRRLGLDAVVARTGCIGFCQREPLVDLLLPHGPRITYGNATVKSIRTLLEAYAAGGTLTVGAALCRWQREEHVADGTFHEYPASSNGVGQIRERSTLEFYRRQSRVILRNCGSIDPLRLEEALARGAYRGALRVLTQMTPEAVIAEVRDSGLRGRGGAGFPTGRKWETARQAAGDRKYVICNADEGDPGAFMDRSVLEGDPHAVLEGMPPTRSEHTRDTSTSAASTRWPYRRSHMPSRRRRAAGCWATTFSAAATASTSRCAAAPGPSCAARKRR